MENKTKKILITGGHSTPAFAVLDELHAVQTNDKYEVVWVGEKFNQRGTKEPSAEYKTVTQYYNLKFIEIKAGKLLRHFSFTAFKEFFNLIVGFVQGFFIILKERPNLVLSFGGFLAVPIVIWSRILGAKVITHEQTITVGLANKIISRFANKVLVSFQETLKFFPINKTIFTGNPIRKEVFEIKSNVTSQFNNDLPLIYITGGNQGAHEINKRVFEVLPELLQLGNVVHQTGNSTITNDFGYAQRLQLTLSDEQAKRYIVKDYIQQHEIGEMFNKADIVISRAGANSVTEILALGKLSILIPIPWTSKNEQFKNAQLVESTGLGFILQQANLSSKQLYDTILFGLNNKNRNIGFNAQSLQNCIKIAQSSIKLNASKEIVDIINSI